jgi:hypothetical protein
VQIEGQKIRGERRLRHGDVVLVGTTQLKVDDPEEKYLREMDEKDRSARAPIPGGATGAAGPVPGAAAPAGTAPAAAAAPARPGRSPEPPAQAAPPEKPPAPAPKPDRPEPPADDASPSDEPDAGSPVRDSGSRILTLLVSGFALAVLGGVLYLGYVMFAGITR